jgi:polysaccharide biosynthesis/export protein
MSASIIDYRAPSAVKAIVQRMPNALRWSSVAALLVVFLMAFAARPVFADQPYLIVPGDILKITVFKNTDLSLDIRVSEAGSIAYPLVGAVAVSGLTLPAAEKKLEQLLQERGFVVNPQVNILLTESYGDLVSVIGEVNKSGRYSVESAGGHVSGMLAAAGGVTANGGYLVSITGTRAGKPFRRDVDVAKTSTTGTAADDVELYGGDTVFIRRAPLFYIYGQVQKPGQYPLETGMTVMQALATGGGTTGKGTQRGIVRHRRDAAGKVKEESVALDDDVQDKDVIYVKESLF